MISTQARPSVAIDALCRTVDDRRLFARWQRRRDLRARDELVRRYTPLARSLVRRYNRTPDHFEDLSQVAIFALVKAIDRYDAQLGNGFSTFAVPTIVGELKRYFRDSSWTVRPPRSLQERVLELEAAERRLATDLGRSPTVNELARYTELDHELIVEALQARHAHRAVSLDAPIAGDEGDGETLASSHGVIDPALAAVDDAISLQRAMAVLSPRGREVVRLRFEEDLTQEEIGERVGVSQMQVSRILRRSLDALREAMT